MNTTREERLERLQKLKRAQAGAAATAPSSAPASVAAPKPPGAVNIPANLPPRPPPSSALTATTSAQTSTSAAPAPGLSIRERLLAQAAAVEAARAKKAEEKLASTAHTAPTTVPSTQETLSLPTSTDEAAPLSADTATQPFKRPREGEAPARQGFPKRPRMVPSDKQSVRVMGIPTFHPSQRVKDLLEGVAGAVSTQFTMVEGSGTCIIDFVEHATSLRLLEFLKTPTLFGVPVTASLYRRQVPVSGYRDLDAIAPVARSWMATVSAGIPGLSRKVAPAVTEVRGPAYERVSDVADIEGWRALVFKRRLIEEDPKFLRQVTSYSDLY